MSSSRAGEKYQPACKMLPLCLLLPLLLLPSGATTARCKQGEREGPGRSGPLTPPHPACPRSTHGLRGRQQGAGQSVDDAVEGQDVPHDDAADHNCPWDL